MSESFFEQFWAKSDKTTLQEHTTYVVKAGENLIKTLSFSPAEKKFWGEKLYMCAVLHDFGKIHPYFQKRIRGNHKLGIRHEIVSLWFCENFLNLSTDMLFAIATHHKGIIPHLDESKRLELFNLQQEMANLYAEATDIMTTDTLNVWLQLMNIKLTTIKKEPEDRISKKQIKILQAKTQIQSVPDTKERIQLSIMRALLLAADHIGSARLENSIPYYKKIIIEDFCPKDKISGENLPFRAFQKKLQYIDTDVILHAPTGSGKTEAALNWILANQKDNSRLYYLLPYTASINAMVKRLQKIYGKELVTALHSKTLDFFYEQLSEEYTNNDVDYNKLNEDARTKKTLSKEIFYPVKVATLHQILKTALKGKGWELTLLDFKNALFIIDEFHTYDALLTGLMLACIKLFKRLFNVKFFFMSATIPDFMLNKIVSEIFDNDKSKLLRPNPLITSDAEVLNRKRHQLYCYKNESILEAIPLIENRLESGKSVLVIVNNVSTCQQLYQKIKFDGTKKLLHSGFNRKSRIKIEKEITHEDISMRPQLLIATQAVEVSLDIDYNTAFIENAPIDALIQRFGRINRAGKLKDEYGNLILAPVCLFENIIGKTPFYNNETLKNTWNKLLLLDKDALSECDLINICNQVYANGYTEDQEKDFNRGLNNTTIREFENNWIAGHWYDWIEEAIEGANNKIDILCGNLVDEYDFLIQDKKYIEASQLLVSVYAYQIDGMKTKQDKKRHIIIDYDFIYNEEIGYIKNKEYYEII